MEQMLSMSGIVERVREKLEKYGLSGRDAIILVAVSGGADSMALINVLHILSKELRLRLTVAHFDHMIRPSSPDDARFVRNVCQRLGVAAAIGHGDVPAYAAQKKLSTETAAREMRYAFLRECARNNGAECIALAHHMGDQIETLLMNMLRGCATSGLAGMSEYSGSLFRPMLGISREEIEAWCFVKNIAYILDETNARTDYTRNRVRLELLPHMREFNPGFDLAAMRLIESAKSDNEALDFFARNAYSEAAREVPGGIALNVQMLLKMPEALSSRVTLLAVRRILGSSADFERVHVSGVRELLKKRSGAQIDLPHMLTAALGYGELLIIRQKSYIFYLPLQNITVTPLGSFVVGDAAPYTAVIDTRKLESAFVRTRRHGDWMRPKGLGGRKKVQDILVDSKIPRVYRDSLPLVAAGDEVLWIPGVCAGEADEGVTAGFEPNEAWPLAGRE